MKYAIEVHAIGYEDTVKVVDAPSLREARRQERQAKVEWCKHNDVGLNSIGLAFTRIAKAEGK